MVGSENQLYNDRLTKLPPGPEFTTELTVFGLQNKLHNE